MSEWAQLLGGGPPPPVPVLERGRWYAVEARTKDGLVRVSIGPHGVRYSLNESFVRIVDHEPNKVTRVRGASFEAANYNEPDAVLTYYGICPEAHRVDDLRASASQVECPGCGTEYLVEDEQHV